VVLPIAAVKEKSLARFVPGVIRIADPRGNRKDLEEFRRV